MDVATKVILVGAAITAVLIPLAIGIAIGGMRRFRVARGLPGRPPVDPKLAWGMIGFAGLLGGFAVLASSLPLVPGVPPLVLVLAVTLVPSLAALGFGRLAPRFGLFERVSRRANGGDLAGAIALLQSRLDRDVPPAPGLSAAPFDPWAPPTAGPPRDPQAAVLCNLMGILQARRDDWPAALGWFERAARLVPAEPTYRLNRGESLVMLGRPYEGLPLAEAAIEEVAPADPFRQVSFRLSLARTLLDAGHRAPARKTLDEADARLRAADSLTAAVRSGLEEEIAGVRVRLAAPSAALPAEEGGVPG